jgi:hypothetical protein
VEAFPYLILDARYERVREAGVIAGQAVLIAIGIDWDGRREVLAFELANRTLDLNPTDGLGDDVTPRMAGGGELRKLCSAGPYKCAADQWKL